MNDARAAEPGTARHVLRAALAYFAWVFGAGFVLGAIRVFFVVPRAGERIAELAEMPVMLAVIVLAARWLVRRFGARLAPPHFAMAGGIALACLLGAELLLAVLLAGRNVAEYLASRDKVSGSVYLAMLVVYAAMPCFLARRARSASR